MVVIIMSFVMAKTVTKKKHAAKVAATIIFFMSFVSKSETKIFAITAIDRCSGLVSVSQRLCLVNWN